LHDFRHNSFVALLVGIAGWIVPGAGHLLLRMWTRGLGVFAVVGALAWTGVALRGRLFVFTTDDFFDLLGFLADCGAGAFFYLAMKYNNGGPDVARAAGDYGTRFFAAAGVLNVLAAVDAYRLARGFEQDEDEAPARGSAARAASSAPASAGADPASQLHLDAPAAPGAESSPAAVASAGPARDGAPTPANPQEPSRE
jgi:hypothetical protein